MTNTASNSSPLPPPRAPVPGVVVVPPPPPPVAFPTAPPPVHPPNASAVRTVSPGQSTTALVLGCCSVLFYATIVVPALAVVFAIAAMRAQRAAGQKFDGRAIAGGVLGVVFCLVGVLFWIAMSSA